MTMRIHKKAAALFLAAACALSLMPANFHAPALAADDPTPYSLEIKRDSLTGDPRKDIISIAVSQLGYKEYRDEKGSKYSWYAKWAKKNKTNWCSEFVSWCANMAGMPADLFPVCTDVGAYRKKFGAMGQVFLLKEGNAEHAPVWLDELSAETITLKDVKPGDILLIGRKTGSTAPHHTCMVRKVNVKKKIIYSYDGNKGSGLSGVIKNSNKAADVYAVVKPLYELSPLTDITLKKSADGYPQLSFSKRDGTDGWRIYRSKKPDKGFTLLEEIPAEPEGNTSEQEKTGKGETGSPALSIAATSYHILQSSQADPPDTVDTQTDTESSTETETKKDPPNQSDTETPAVTGTESNTETEKPTETEKQTEKETQKPADPKPPAESGTGTGTNPDPAPSAAPSSTEKPSAGTPKDNGSGTENNQGKESKPVKETEKPTQPKPEQPVPPNTQIDSKTSVCTYTDRKAGKGSTWYYKVVPYKDTPNGNTYDGLGFRCKVLCTKDNKEVSLPCSHKYNCFETEAGNCKQKNTVKYVCIYCGKSYTKHERMGSHDYRISKTIEPIATECGKKVYTCIRCNSSYDKTFDAKSFTVDQVKYSVLSSSSRTVTVTGPADKKATSILIPKTVKFNGKEYRVREIKKKAFRKLKNLKDVTIMANLKSIHTEAFYKSKKIKNITFSQKTPPTFNSKVFAGIPVKARITVPSAGYKKFKKLLTKKGYLAKKTKKKSKKKKTKDKLVLKKAKKDSKK